MRREEGSPSLAGAFQEYVKAKRNESPEEKYKDVRKKCSKAWAEMSEAEKLEFAVSDV